MRNMDAEEVDANCFCDCVCAGWAEEGRACAALGEVIVGAALALAGGGIDRLALLLALRSAAFFAWAATSALRCAAAARVASAAAAALRGL